MTSRTPTWAGRLPQLAFEFTAIVFGVLLALAFDDWRDRRKSRKTVESVVETIRLEVLENRKSVAEALEYHEVLLDELRRGERRMASLDIDEHAIDTSSAEGLLRSLRRVSLESGSPLPDEARVLRSENGGYLFVVDDRTSKIRIEEGRLNMYGKGNVQLRSARVRNTSWDTAQATQSTIHMKAEIVAAMSELYHIQNSYANIVSATLGILYTGNGSVIPPLEDLKYYEALLLEKYEALLQMLGGEVVAG